MMIGYARTSTTDQAAGLEAQVRDLKLAGVEKPLPEQTGATGDRPVFEKIMATIKRGDVLVVTKLDRLARSVVHLGQILDTLEKRGAALRILNLGLDTSTPTGKLMLNVLGSVAQFEREIMLERQREGIAKARAEGKYTGRVTEISSEKVKAEVDRVWSLGFTKSDAIRSAVEKFKISERQVYRHLNGR